MPWTTNPTFVNGTILQATALNTLSDNTAFLNTLVALNPLFRGEKYTADWGAGDASWVFRHRSRYLHYKARLTLTDIDLFKINVNGTDAFTDAVTRSAPYTYSGVIDLDINPGSLVIGTAYIVYLTGTFTTSPPHEMFLDYLWQSDSNTL